jgi:hypothetical protein
MNHLYKVADRDGTVIGAVSGAAAFAPLQGVKAAASDATKYNWVGSPNSETGMLIVWHTVPVEDIQEAMKTEIIVGSSSENSSTSLYARGLNATLGLKLKIIHGYPGTSESYLAMERGELQGYPSAFLSSLQSTRPTGSRIKKSRFWCSSERSQVQTCRVCPLRGILLKPQRIKRFSI